MTNSAVPLANNGIDSLFAKLPISGCADRFEWITERCSGKHVLDLGCADETAFKCKREGSRWLHREIKRVAKQVVGIDTSTHIPRWKVEYPEEMACIVQGDMCEAEQITRDLEMIPEVIVGGEIIEHLIAPDDIFKAILPVMASREAELLITTPNPFGYQAFMMALLNRESQHVDHRYLLTPKILLRLADQCGYELVEMRTAYTEYNEFYNRPGPLKYILKGLNTLVFIPLQWLIPATGGTLRCAFRLKPK